MDGIEYVRVLGGDWVEFGDGMEMQIELLTLVPSFGDVITWNSELISLS